MAYQVLARKYRPQKFSDVIGQPHVTRTLQNALEQGRIAHGYIFSGHRGIGKTTVARILAMSLNCRGADGKADHPQAEPCGVCDSCIEVREGRAVDVIEIDAATNRGIDEIRELRDAARYRPARDRFKIYILDEAHQITDAAFNALLKTLEEPPAHVIFMMATTQPEDIPQTIRSRCQHFSFHAVRFDEIVAQLGAIAGREGIQADDDALALLAEAGDGSMRDALSIMDQAMASSGDRLTVEVVRQLVGSVPAETLEELLGAVARDSSQEVLRLLDRLITEGQSPVYFARQLVRFLRNATVAKVAGGDSPLLQISSDERARVARVAAEFSEEDLARFLQIMLRTHSELGWRQEQRFHLELGLLKLVHAQRLLPLEELLSQAGGAPARDPGVASASRSTAAAPTKPASEPPRGGASPFDADRARKVTLAPGGAGEPVAGSRATKPSGRELSSAATPQAHVEVEAEAELVAGGAVGVAELPPALRVDGVREHVLAALEGAGQNGAAAELERGLWTLDELSGELTVQLGRAQAVVEMIFAAEARRVATAAASSVLGRPVRIKAVGGASGNGVPVAAPRSAPAGTARSRAGDDPVVRRMQEKFGAEIRTVIDHKNKS